MAVKPSTTDSTILLLKEMVDKDYLYIWGSTSGGSNRSFSTREFKRITPTPEQTKLLRARGRFYEYLTTIADGMKGHKKVAWYETASEINEVGRKLVEDNRARIEAKIAAQKAKDAQSERLVIFSEFSGATEHFGIIQKIGGLFRVTRETGKRLFGELVEAPNSRRSYGLTHGGARILGSTETYIDLENVIVDPATPEMYEAMLYAECALFEDLEEKKYQREREIAEIERRFRQRAVQSMAQSSDSMAEAGVPREIVDQYVETQQARSNKQQVRQDERAVREAEWRERRLSRSQS